jgi:hypothetical protein
VIDAIRTWSVPGQLSTDPLYLGDFYKDVRLYLGGPNADLTPKVAAPLSPGSDETGNPNIRLTEITRNGHPFYDDFGDNLRIWQIDFTRLDWTVEGGVKYQFGVWGNGRPVPETDGKAYKWFNHASHASLSASRQDGADGLMLLFDAAGRAEGSFTAEGNGWDKTSDINVQIFAHRIDQ